MNKTNVIVTAYCYIIACFLDLITTFHLLNMGYIEHNALYHLIGANTFWIVYIITTPALLILLLVASKKWWWSYLILWLPTIVHGVCAINNFSILL